MYINIMSGKNYMSIKSILNSINIWCDIKFYKQLCCERIIVNVKSIIYT